MGLLFLKEDKSMGNVIMRAEQIDYQDINVKVALDACTPAAIEELEGRIEDIEDWIESVAPTGGE